MPRRKKNFFDKIKDYLDDSFLADFVYHNPEVKTAFYIALLIGALSWFGVFRFGPIKLTDDNTITVIGTHSTQEYNRTATFIATISDTSTDKDGLIRSINERSVELTEKVREFGVDKLDIKTTNNYIYQVQDPQILEQYRGDQDVWMAGTSLEIKVRDINKVKDLTILLTGFGDVEIYGPNYSLDEEDVDEAMMLSQAVDDAYEKAEYLARAQSKMIGRIISIEEVSGMSVRSYGGEVLGLGSGGGGDFSPGATEITKTVRVKFKLLR